jgi:hypothetical protein
VSDGPRMPDGAEKIGSGVVGLDEVLAGGFPVHRFHLVVGDPGTGKTTLALRFLLEGARRGERVLYVTLSETAEELRAVARSHGWALDGIAIYELVPAEERLRPDQQYTILHPSEVELGRPPRRCCPKSREPGRYGSSSTRCPSCACWPATRWSTGGRSSVCPGAGLLTQEALAPVAARRPLAALATQPPWSDLPLIVLVSGGAMTRAVAELVERLGTRANATFLERPVRATTLVSAVRSGLHPGRGLPRGGASLGRGPGTRHPARGAATPVRALL